MIDKLFWPFVFLFYTGATLLAVYMQEAAIAAIFGILLGEAIAAYRRVSVKPNSVKFKARE